MNGDCPSQTQFVLMNRLTITKAANVFTIVSSYENRRSTLESRLYQIFTLTARNLYQVAAHYAHRNDLEKLERCAAAKPARNEKTMKKNVIKIALLATALSAAPLTWGIVSAQTAPAATATQAAVNYANVFIGKLATALGVTADKLNAGISSASTATIDEALKNQDITKTQADQLKLNVQNGRNPFLESRGFGQRRSGMDGGRSGMNGGSDSGPGMGSYQIASLEAAAKALGMTATDLEAQFRAGQTLEQVATAKKVTVKTVQDAVIAALQTQLAAEVKAGKITQAKADEIIAKAKANTNFGLRFGGGGRGPRR